MEGGIRSKRNCWIVLVDELVPLSLFIYYYYFRLQLLLFRNILSFVLSFIPIEKEKFLIFALIIFVVVVSEL